MTILFGTPGFSELAFILGGIVLSYGLYRLLQVGSRPKDIPPGPPTIPILGNLHQIPKDNAWLQYQRWAQEYGPIYSLMYGTRVRIILSSDQAVKDLLDKRSHIYSGRPSMYIGQDIISAGKRAFLNTNNAWWRTARKMVHTVLNINVIKTYLPYQDLESKIMLASMIDNPEEYLTHIQRYTYSFTSQMVYGFRCPSFDDERLKILFETFHQWGEAIESVSSIVFDAYPILQRLPTCLTPVIQRAKQLHEAEAENYTHHWLATKQRLQEGKNLPCFCNDALRLQSILKFDDLSAAYLGASLLAAGSETSAETQYACFSAMAIWQEVQKRAREEIDRVVGPDRLPEFEDYPSLPYIRCCIKETLRWCPLVPLGNTHATTAEDWYLGYRIPNGAAVNINVWAINNDENRAPNPRVFNPDRHSDDTTTLFQSAIGDPKKRDSFSFGAGRRQCPGIHIAERTVFLGIARLLWGFEIHLKKGPDGRPIRPDTEHFSAGLIARPKKYNADIIPRDEKRMNIIRQAVREDENLLDPETKQWKKLPEGVKLPDWTPGERCELGPNEKVENSLWIGTCLSCCLIYDLGTYSLRRPSASALVLMHKHECTKLRLFWQ
ncbi:hypothetical protein KEM56_006862 [Ascosphaera pollenicola]|nr:hypothetical protein KEM56_006862 [Ascosphaera pollenicola]